MELIVKHEYKKPEVKQSRHHSDCYDACNVENFKLFKEKYPHYKIKYNTFCSIVKTNSELMWEHVINSREGIDLPEALGQLSVISCRFKGKSNINYRWSNEHGKRVLHSNIHTDNLLAKVYYSNADKKYLSPFKGVWAFKACRNFSRSVSKAFRENYKLYREVDLYQTMEKTNKCNPVIEPDIKKQNEDFLANYNELSVD
jgi:hypothetical protein